MQHSHSLTFFALLGFIVPYAFSDCASYGTDFVDGGGPYCINTQLTDYFSFGTDFEGCSSSDVQGAVTPILVNPNNDQYFCSDIPVTPGSTVYYSTCNVTNNEVTKNNMFSGTWTIVIEGLTFAYQRSFSVIAGPPVVVTSTPTATFTATSTPTVTATSTNTIVSSTVLSASTVTSPSTTITKTSTVTAGPTTTWSTVTLTPTAFSLTNLISIKTVTVTTSCKTNAQAYDRPKTISITKSRRGLSPAEPTGAFKRSLRGRNSEAEAHRALAARAILPRAAGDLCTTTSVETTLIVSTTTTVTAPASTSVTVVTTTTSTTITPTPVTVYTGSKVVTVTSTKPGRTFTFYTVTAAPTTVTRSVLATITSTIAVPPSGVACVKS